MNSTKLKLTSQLVVPDESHVINYDDVEIQSDGTYEERPLKIVERRVKQLRNKEVPLVRVLWSKDGKEGTTWETWETERDMQRRFPQLMSS